MDKLSAAQRKKVVAKAIADGKISEARRAYWEDLVARIPHQAVPLLAGMARVNPGLLKGEPTKVAASSHRAADTKRTTDELPYPSFFLTADERARVAKRDGLEVPREVLGARVEDADEFPYPTSGLTAEEAARVGARRPPSPIFGPEVRDVDPNAA